MAKSRTKRRSIDIRLSMRTYNDIVELLALLEGAGKPAIRRKASMVTERLMRAPRVSLRET